MFPLGKLPPELLTQFIDQFSVTDPALILGPGVGRDCAVIDLGGDQLLVAKSDPITFATDEIGWYAVHVNANDIATTGATPRWFLATILLPQAIERGIVDQIFGQIRSACAELKITVVGGHTEVTYDLKRPLVIGSLFGLVPRSQLIVPTGARPGDAVIFTKRLAIEATAIIARERYPELVRKFGAEWLDRCKSFLQAPGLSVVPDARIATSAGRVHAMHDPTEGGLATALHELAVASGVDLLIDGGVVPTYPETRALCNHYRLDMWGVIASGSLLLAVESADARAIVTALRDANIEAAAIGRVMAESAEPQVRVKYRDEVRVLSPFGRDEIAQLFE
ncbi:MAG: AIR synthase family protein [Anaerolineae bacterium]